MFPQLDDHKIQEALSTAHNNIEAAISHILETAALQTTPQQVYASFEFCNNIDSDDDFRDSDPVWCITYQDRREPGWAPGIGGTAGP